LSEGPKEGVGVRAAYWHPEGARLRCDLCPQRCLVAPGHTGYCGTRSNVDGELIALNYGKVCVSASDPIEKKPVYHYMPGSKLYSIGTFGCNLDCGNCQNSTLARLTADKAPYVLMKPEEVADNALASGASGVAFTYNEPTVWIEFILDTAPVLRQKGLFAVLNTNGFVEPWAADDLFDMVEAANIDVKGMSESFYRTNCHGKLKPVLESCIAARQAGVHVELNYLLIPGMNDSAEEVGKFASWVTREMGEDVPVHLCRFQPAYRMTNVEPEDMAALDRSYGIAKAKGLEYVYVGGVAGDRRQDTSCPRCGALLIKRSSKEPTEPTFVLGERISRYCPTYTEVSVLLDRGKCPKCGKSIPVVIKP
jgi:pyruvate formate lyase activating enzyme